MEQGAGFILNYHTSHFALHQRGRLREGETVLVHGAAGGMGTAALQIARGSGARTIAVVSSDEKERVARGAGAHEVVSSTGDWIGAAMELTGGKGVELVYDPVGGERFTTACARWLPKVACSWWDSPRVRSPPWRPTGCCCANVSVVGVGWGEFVENRPELVAEIGRDLERLADEGFVRPMVGAIYPLEEGSQALLDLAERRATGKLILKVR